MHLLERRLVVWSIQGESIHVYRCLCGQPYYFGSGNIFHSCQLLFRACHETEITIEPDSVNPSEKLNIGVVGTGPAGMAFTHTAATIGHNVTLFDKSNEIGGMIEVCQTLAVTSCFVACCSNECLFHSNIRAIQHGQTNPRQGRIS